MYRDTGQAAASSLDDIRLSAGSRACETLANNYIISLNYIAYIIIITLLSLFKGALLYLLKG
jgi:hypothetical protein